MNRMNNRKILCLVLAVMMALLLTACEFSSSSTSTTTVTTSSTDSDGNTVTHTTTTETNSDGVTTKTETTETTGAAELETQEFDEEAWGRFVDRLYATYDTGAVGENEAGDHFYYAYSEEEGNSDAILAIVSADGTSYFGREGVTSVQDDHVVLHSDETNDDTAYDFSEVDENGQFTITFVGDGDVALMHLVDQDTVLQGILENLRSFL